MTTDPKYARDRARIKIDLGRGQLSQEQADLLLADAEAAYQARELKRK